MSTVGQKIDGAAAGLRSVVSGLQGLVSQIMALVMAFASLALLIVFVDVVAQPLGFDVPFVRGIGATELAYMAGAYWLVRKAG